MNFEIVTDSSANLTEEQIDRFDLHILTLTVMIEDKEYAGYTKGQKTDLRPIYNLMREKKKVVTSATSPGICRDMFEEMLKEGKDILYIGFSSGLSATYGTASAQLMDLKAQYPERIVMHIDTLSAAMGEGLLVYKAAQMREQGKTMQEVFDFVEATKLHVCHWVTVDDLFHLKRGGRLPAATAIIGSMLGIKPLIHVNNEGKLVPMGKVKGRRAALDELVKKLEETAIDPKEETIFISHGDCEEDAQYVADKIKARYGTEDIVLNCLEPVVGGHAGPGTVALFFIGSSR